MAPGWSSNLLQREVPAGQARASSVLAEQHGSGVKRVLRGYLRFLLVSGLGLLDRDVLQEFHRSLVPVALMLLQVPHVRTRLSVSSRLYCREEAIRDETLIRGMPAAEPGRCELCQRH